MSTPIKPYPTKWVGYIEQTMPTAKAFSTNIVKPSVLTNLSYTPHKVQHFSTLRICINGSPCIFNNS